MQLGNINEYNKWYQLDHQLEKCRHISVDQWSTVQGFPSWLWTNLVISPRARQMNHFRPWALCCVHTEDVSCRWCQPSYPVTYMWHACDMHVTLGVPLKSHGAHAAELRDGNNFPEPQYSSLTMEAESSLSRGLCLTPQQVSVLGAQSGPADGESWCPWHVHLLVFGGASWKACIKVGGIKCALCTLNWFHISLSPHRSWLRQSRRKC